MDKYILPLSFICNKRIKDTINSQISFDQHINIITIIYSPDITADQVMSAFDSTASASSSSGSSSGSATNEALPTPNAIPQLQTMCEEYIIKLMLTDLQVCFQVYRYIGTMRLSEKVASLFLPIVMKKFRYHFPELLVKFPGEKELEDCFLPEDWQSLEKMYKEGEAAKLRMSYYKGEVVERVAANVASEDQAFYPLAALLAGVAWPKNVDPANRELFLSEEEFFKVFQMTKADFRGKDKYLRIRMKKEKGLF